ncbi:MAG: MoxR-like ATPase, partial [Candidatus Omnitrophota bacterium]
RISPRRVRQLVKNLHAVIALRGGAIADADFLLALNWSIPHRAWGVRPSPEVVRAAHRVAWDSAFLSGHEAWLNSLLIESKPYRIVRKILRECPDPDIGSVAVNQCLKQADPARRAAFAFALYPAALEGHLPIGREGVNDLARAAAEIMEVDGDTSWHPSRGVPDTTNPERERLSAVLAKRRGQRRERATQLFNHLLVENLRVEDPATYEEEFNRCIAEVRSYIRQA